MPTIGYIAETALDRYYERGEDFERPPPVFACELCDAEFGSPLDLSRHVPEAHPAAPPRLAIWGRVIVGSEVVRKELLPGDVTVLGATEIDVRTDKGTLRVTESELQALLIGRRRSHFKIHLRNKQLPGGTQAREEVQLRIDVPDTDTLDRVDGAFAATFAGTDVTAQELEVFDSATSGFDIGLAYASALYEYAISIAIKDRAVAPVTGDRLIAARDKAQSALAVLRDFDQRPVARAAAGLIRFSVNDVRGWRISGVPKLDDCAGGLCEAVDARWSPPRAVTDGGLRKEWPLDRASMQLVEAWHERAGPDRFSALARNADWQYEDVAKARALAMLSCEDGEPVDTETATNASLLVHDPVFGGWADGWLAAHGLGH